MTEKFIVSQVSQGTILLVCVYLLTLHSANEFTASVHYFIHCTFLTIATSSNSVSFKHVESFYYEGACG